MTDSFFAVVFIRAFWITHCTKPGGRGLPLSNLGASTCTHALAIRSCFNPHTAAPHFFSAAKRAHVLFLSPHTHTRGGTQCAHTRTSAPVFFSEGIPIYTQMQQTFGRGFFRWGRCGAAPACPPFFCRRPARKNPPGVGAAHTKHTNPVFLHVCALPGGGSGCEGVVYAACRSTQSGGGGGGDVCTQGPLQS